MTKRYYIDDPLQAAMAARDFGFYYLDAGSQTINSVEIDAEFYSNGSINYAKLNDKFLLHPKCEELLQPRVGDLIGYTMEAETMQGCKYYKETYCLLYSDNFPLPKDLVNVRIIQRAYRPFPIIEREEV